MCTIGMATLMGGESGFLCQETGSMVQEGEKLGLEFFM